jgi:hypothetical protein
LVSQPQKHRAFQMNSRFGAKTPLDRGLGNLLSC